ncbi:MAG TPA: hypothetical protein VHT75_10925 [Acidimicrobiales bacterium]|nr:hypothetical protein [Acidimicrobiales bacterium]
MRLVRPLLIVRPAGAGAALILFGLVIGGCNGSSGAVATTTTTVVVTTTTTTSTVPPTTVFQPTAPQASQDLAAAHIVAAWKAGDRAAAAADATPAAVAAVFAQPFPAGGVQARGCSSAVAGPSSCIYRVLANGNLLSLSALPVSGGWIISDAQFES